MEKRKKILYGGIGVVVVAVLAAVITVIVVLTGGSEDSTSVDIEKDLQEFLANQYEKSASSMCTRLNFAEWNYNTDINNQEKQEILLNVTLEAAAFEKEYWEKYFKDLNPDHYQNEQLKRQINILKKLGNAALDEEKLSQLTTSVNAMTNIYSTAKICPFDNQNCDLTTDGLYLEPGIEEVLASTNYDELTYAWKAWRDASGAKMREHYQTYVELSNEAAAANDFADKGELWRASYESSTFIQDVDDLWEQVEPLYVELHKYVGNKLKERFGDKLDNSDGLLPAHVFGNMWAQDWTSLAELVKPYPEASKIDVDQALLDQGYTVLQMFETSDEFYKSMGLLPNDISYNVGEGAMIERPTDGREVLCHASAWDFCDGQNYRIKMCTSINFEDFTTVHHEMGHIQYFLQYAQQPYSFRDGANPGFHEAVGDTIALSVSTPKHLEKIKLLENYDDNDESSVNALMDMALQKIAFLPFGLLIDKWRWDIFSGEVPQDKWNSHWWEYRKKYQKVKPPVDRSENDFDPGAKFHVAGDYQYIAYFVAHIVQFQFYKTLCVAAGEYDPDTKEVPLHKCDFYESKEAGAVFSQALSLGASKHWSDVLEEMTGERKMDASALLEYFEPLYNFLKEQNSKMSETELQEFLTNVYEKSASAMCTQLNLASWDYNTDINNKAKQEVYLNVTLESANLRKENWEKYFKNLNPDDYKDEELKRQVRSLKNLGNAALDENKLAQLTTTVNTMKNIYSVAKICPYDKQDCDVTTDGLRLEPEIQTVLAKSTNYEELLHVWTAWRDVSGAKMRDLYQTYVDLSNEAAVANGFETKTELWKERYESSTFVEDIDKLWEQVEPLYVELHTYVGNKLKGLFGDKLDNSDGLLPAHVFGNMWAQDWSNLAQLVKPYPKASQVDVDQALLDQDYTVLKMFETSDEFYKSMGLLANDISYNTSAGAMIERPTDGREVVCHASAWDFCDGENYRIKMCTEVNFEDFTTVHHEMGHIQYFEQYANLPYSFRTGANPGFHEAVGDTIALSVSTPKHLEKIGLLKDYEDTDESSINALMDMALQKIAFLPFGLLIDKWRWEVFSKDISQEQWNSHWWNYRKKYQKIKPPVDRSESHFDPGAKYHVAGDSQYIAYFVAHILQFQFYKTLCIAAGEYNSDTKAEPLHKCDFYNSKEAGTIFSRALSLGASKHWSDVLEDMTGERKMDATALLEYFEPLYNFLKEENSKEVMSETELQEFLTNVYEKSASSMCSKMSFAAWDYNTDINNPEKQEIYLSVTLEAAALEKENWQKYFQHLNPDNYENEQLKRQVASLKALGNAALDEDKLESLTSAVNKMTNIYSTAKICPFEKQGCDLATDGLYLEPEIQAVLVKSTDYDELLYVWKAWRDASGAKMKEHYRTYVALSNEAAVANNFANKGELWRERYESSTFVEDIDNLWDQVKPLYDELHKYVGNKLKERFGAKLDNSDGLLPAHVFGNMWAQDWSSLAQLVKPYPEASKVDVDQALLDQGYTVLKMFEMSDEFYQSMGLLSNDISYNTSAGAMIEKPTDGREVLCHASAWDFCDGQNYRIKMCTEVNFEDFTTVHHEMGHIQYYEQYADQPYNFRTGANPGFHEAVGDTIALSVSTPKHLEKIGLLTDYKDTDESSINALMDMALQKVAFLPFGLLIDKWRWDVFSGDVPQEEWNSHWWKYRQQYQKIKPPVERTETDFDPGAKYHVAGDSQYIAYFVAHILQFQFYKSLCEAAGEYNSDTKDVPLHKCDFYQSTKAGNVFSKALSLGASKHWSDVLQELTGERKMDATALLEYFEPLYNFLQEENAKMSETELQEFLISEYEDIASSMCTRLNTAAWNYNTDIDNPEKQEIYLDITLESASLEKANWERYFKNLNPDDYKDEQLKRQVRILRILGDAVLEEDKLAKLTTAVNSMTNIYSTAKICPYDNQECELSTEGLYLEPGIQAILSTSTDYDELLYLWDAWRKASGAKMTEHFQTYVELANEAAVANGFSDKGQLWRDSYESSTFVENIDELWHQVEPLYVELHAYVGNKLKAHFGDKLDNSDGLLPAHVFGNMWAQEWSNIADLVTPYPDATKVNVDQALIDQEYTVLKMFEMSDDFYQSMGLLPNDISYNVTAGAMIEKPNDGREVLCHASAWDFCDGQNYRIKMCTEVNFEDFTTVHHEMGHIQYYEQYAKQPYSFRGGANPGFHEAVGDTIALSVSTPKHLKKIGLLTDYDDTEESSINALMDMAMQRVAFLPFGLLIDKWRWDVFSGAVTPQEWNSHWWAYREKYQKIKAPVERSENDFDPGAKLHVAADSQYIAYFVARILQFQFYKALCIAAGEYDPATKEVPLHKCDFYGSEEAGKKFSQTLSLGASKHWSDVLEDLTGDRNMNANALLEYFEPLYTFLKEENAKHKIV